MPNLVVFCSKNAVLTVDDPYSMTESHVTGPLEVKSEKFYNKTTRTSSYTFSWETPPKGWSARFKVWNKNKIVCVIF